MIKTQIFGDLEVITPEKGGVGKELKCFSVMKNEPFSFQMAYKLFPDENVEKNPEELHFFIRLTTELDISTYHVACVPVMHGFEKISPKPEIGMYPDILMPKKTNPELARQTVRGGCGYRYIEVGEKISLSAYNDSWRQVWFTLNENENEMPVGKHLIKIELYNGANNKVGENELEIEVIDASLPEQSLYYTNWFHNDCMADFYGLELFSDEYYTVMKDFLRTAVKNGMNMLLLPAFTPALDTAIGEERMTVQLVKVKKNNGKYSFDFSMMKRYIDEAREAGIKYFEHSHLFTQWGAAHAPKIIAEVDGETKRIFGWDTEAAGKEYNEFLRQYIPQMFEFLKGEGLDKTTLFHFSDEPAEDNFDSYKKSVESVKDMFEGYTVGDALSMYAFYETGLVQTPIARIHKAMDFVGKCDNLWIYYTGGECYDGLSNRLINLPRERNRALGYMLYYHNAKGFLHWGYNYYYGRLAHGLYDPAIDPCCGFPNAGTTYSVYPGRDRKPLQSIHQKIFADGLVDMRALQLLESLAGREVCKKLIDDMLGSPNFFNTPETPEKLMEFRIAVNKEIKNHL
ncbi:MAG: DUF4091 domain-containing protein [Ruminococcaceae bacterium]|nr:DUF4091 domain-containing protein [Oscillospiraceae bacterium]